MRKLIILLVVVGLLVAGVWKLRGTSIAPGFMQGKLDTVGKGDLTIPINGTGEIRAKARSEIKPEASGEVISIPFQAGQMVKKGDLLIQLDRSDEERNVRRSQNELDRAQATLEQAKLTLQQRSTTAFDQLDAQIAGVEAQIRDAKFHLDKSQRLRDQGNESEDVLVTMQARYDQLNAQLKGLRADRAQAEIAAELAKRDVTNAQKAVENADTALGDARERLSETEIRSPIDGMIAQMNAEMGEVVQGGRTTITGGTILAVVADISEIVVYTEVADADIGAVLWLAPVPARPGGNDLAPELSAKDVSLQADVPADRAMSEGTPVKVRVDAFRNEDFHGVIERIYPEPKKIQNIVTYLVDININSENWKKLALVLGMQADVTFVAQSVKNAILVPHDAIKKGKSGGLGVYVPTHVPGKPDRPKFVSCRFGLDNGMFAELLEGEGIGEGTEVYTQLPARFESGEEETD